MQIKASKVKKNIKINAYTHPSNNFPEIPSDKFMHVAIIKQIMFAKQILFALKCASKVLNILCKRMLCL